MKVQARKVGVREHECKIAKLKARKTAKAQAFISRLFRPMVGLIDCMKFLDTTYNMNNGHFMA
jgi:hypothetical protein